MQSNHREPFSWRNTSMIDGIMTLLYSISLLVLFWPLLYGGEILAFRDTLHFYFPLWDYIARQPWPMQCLPEWNPYDGDGASMLAEPTTGAFYPFRILLHLPWLATGQRIGIYLWIHMVFMYWGALWGARFYGIGRKASHLTAVTYSLAGPVFFQIYNPIFLVGAAWLPIAWRGLSEIRALPYRPSSIRVSALALSMMILGGDPQTAYHCLWLSLLIGLFTLHIPVGNASQPASRRWMQFPLRWLAMALLAFAMSLVQIVPSAMRLSESLRRTHLIDRYEFSVAPWDMVSMAWPNVLGSFVHGHTRWVEVFPLEPRMWVPSLHLGSLSLLAMLVVCRYRRWGRNELLALFGIAMLSSMGWWGGLQVLWNGLLPWYDQFRYPAKWLTLMSWGGALLAGMGFSSLCHACARRTFKGWLQYLGVTCLTLAVLVSVWLLSHDGFAWLEQLCRSVPPDSVIGELSPTGVRRDVLLSLWSTTLVIATGWVVLRFVDRRFRLWAFWWLTSVQLVFAAWCQRVTVAEAPLRAAARSRLDATAGGSGDLEGGQGLGGRVGGGGAQPEAVLRQARQHLGKMHLLVPEHNARPHWTLAPNPLAKWSPGSSQVVTQRDYGGEFRVANETMELFGRWTSANRMAIQYRATQRAVLEFDLPARGWDAWVEPDSLGGQAGIETDRSGEDDLVVGGERRRFQLRLAPGDGVITMRYRTPGLWLGLIGSCMAWCWWGQGVYRAWLGSRGLKRKTR